MSAPTVRFLRALDRLRLLSSTQKQKIAASVYSEIKPFVGGANVDALCRAAQAAQDKRWRFISAGTGDMTEIEFATVVLSEQWLLAQAALRRPTPPVAEVLAQKRSDAIEGFIRDHLSFERGELIHLHSYTSVEERSPTQISKTAA